MAAECVWTGVQPVGSVTDGRVQGWVVLKVTEVIEQKKNTH